MNGAWMACMRSCETHKCSCIRLHVLINLFGRMYSRMYICAHAVMLMPIIIFTGPFARARMQLKEKRGAEVSRRQNGCSRILYRFIIKISVLVLEMAVRSAPSLKSAYGSFTRLMLPFISHRHVFADACTHKCNHHALCTDFRKMRLH